MVLQIPTSPTTPHLSNSRLTTNYPSLWSRTIEPYKELGKTCEHVCPMSCITVDRDNPLCLLLSSCQQ